MDGTVWAAWGQGGDRNCRFNLAPEVDGVQVGKRQVEPAFFSVLFNLPAGCNWGETQVQPAG
jgi:hypothetical protein